MYFWDDIYFQNPLLTRCALCLHFLTTEDDVRNPALTILDTLHESLSLYEHPPMWGEGATTAVTSTFQLPSNPTSRVCLENRWPVAYDDVNERVFTIDGQLSLWCLEMTTKKRRRIKVTPPIPYYPHAMDVAIVACGGESTRIYFAVQMMRKMYCLTATATMKEFILTEIPSVESTGGLCTTYSQQKDGGGQPMIVICTEHHHVTILNTLKDPTTRSSRNVVVHRSMRRPTECVRLGLRSHKAAVMDSGRILIIDTDQCTVLQTCRFPQDTVRTMFVECNKPPTCMAFYSSTYFGLVVSIQENPIVMWRVDEGKGTVEPTSWMGQGTVGGVVAPVAIVFTKGGTCVITHSDGDCIVATC